MENQKNSKGIIALLIIIIVILSVLCILFATGTISFNSKSTNNNQQNNSESVTSLSDDEAITIVKNIFTNSTVQYLVDHPSVTYCKTEATYISEKELGLNYQWNGYQKCTDFKSYEELTNHFKQYITENYFNELLLNERYLRDKNTMADGTIMYNYYEKDGNLYAASTGKGANVNKYKLLNDEIVYKIDAVNNNQITASITAKWDDVNNNKYTELEKITIINDNGNWKINSYESTTV